MHGRYSSRMGKQKPRNISKGGAHCIYFPDEFVNHTMMKNPCRASCEDNSYVGPIWPLFVVARVGQIPTWRTSPTTCWLLDSFGSCFIGWLGFISVPDLGRPILICSVRSRALRKAPHRGLQLLNGFITSIWGSLRIPSHGYLR